MDLDQIIMKALVHHMPILLYLLGFMLTVWSMELDQGGWVELFPLTGLLCTPLSGPGFNALCVSVTQEIGTQHNHIYYTAPTELCVSIVKVIKTDRYTKLL